MTTLSLRSFKVAYKYAAPMTVIVRDVSYFIQSQLQKLDLYQRKKTELHVSPFYEHKITGFFAYQPVFDLDGAASFGEARAFLTSLIKPSERKYFFVERSGNSIHLVCHLAFYPIDHNEIKYLRLAIKEIIGRNLTTLDVSHCVRHLPIRRTPGLSKLKDKLVMPVPAKTFLTKSRTELDLMWQKFEVTNKKQLEHLITQYTLPVKIVPWHTISLFDEVYKRMNDLKKLGV